MLTWWRGRPGARLDPFGEETRRVPVAGKSSIRVRWNLEFHNSDAERRWWNARLSGTHRHIEKVACFLGLFVSLCCLKLSSDPFPSFFVIITSIFALVHIVLLYTSARADSALYIVVHDKASIALRVLRMLIHLQLCGKGQERMLDTMGQGIASMYLVFVLGSHLVTIPLTFWLRFKHHIWVQMALSLSQIFLNYGYACDMCFDRMEDVDKQTLIRLSEHLFEIVTGMHIPCRRMGFTTTCKTAGTLIPTVFGTILTSTIIYLCEKSSRMASNLLVN